MRKGERHVERGGGGQGESERGGEIGKMVETRGLRDRQIQSELGPTERQTDRDKFRA